MRQIGSIIAASTRANLLYAERVLKGVTPKEYARLACPGGQVVISNHPAFILGHLCLYPSRVMQLLGLPLGDTAAPAPYEAIFKAGCDCRDDPQATLYPALDELTARFFAGYRGSATAVENSEDEAFLRPNPTEGRMRELFPTTGAALGFYLGGHMQNHLGQLSAWRRMMGMGPAS